MGDRIAVMSNGLLQQVGSPQDLYDTPVNRFVAGFIGSPSMNFVEVTIKGSGDDATLEGQDATIPIPPRLRGAVGRATSGKLVAGFRPDHLDLGTGGPDMATISGRADVVEYLGDQELLHVRRPARTSWPSSTPPPVRPGDTISLVLPLDKLHLFDSETGVSVTQLVGDMPATDVTAADGTTRTADTAGEADAPSAVSA